MRIFILPVAQESRPDSQAIVYPAYNHDYGVEQDFYNFLERSKNLVTFNIEEADWHYLPIYWTRWHLNHNYASHGVQALQKIVDKAIIDPRITFSVCQYDDGPIVKLHGAQVMLASRKGKVGIDIPLLAKPLKTPLIKPKKVFTASFMGRLSTHPIRSSMYEAVKNMQDIEVVNDSHSAKEYVKKMLQSHVALCPRGYGGSSFRFFEAMQLGIPPFLIGTEDIRPFKSEINWDQISFYTPMPENIPSIIGRYTKKEFKEMGQKARKVWQNDLQYQKWCRLALKELK